MDMERAEQEHLLKLEEEYAKQMKRRRQREVKSDLDECLREKLKRKAKEVQEGLLQDLFFVKQIMEGEEEQIKSDKKIEEASSFPEGPPEGAAGLPAAPSRPDATRGRVPERGGPAVPGGAGEVVGEEEARVGGGEEQEAEDGGRRHGRRQGTDHGQRREGSQERAADPGVRPEGAGGGRGGPTQGQGEAQDDQGEEQTTPEGAQGECGDPSLLFPEHAS
ncbi:hypothetical protein CEXT_255561 [Caerostris extrusa]|uniref:Uncharacterized protein n=1 Tax=Caerostris extrusa TaxID=172846 RepID=A0AAV4YG99_CAEEX|nr:hypothetical protein CEXT_255561 [Caerostris extrusa]